MQYRKFGKLDWEVSVLGFGGMRFPSSDGQPRSNNIDKQEATRLVRYAIDAGVNYLDTAYVYHGGNSELLFGEALQDGYRQRVRIATKSPVWFIREPADFDRFLGEQLTRLKTDHVDFYLLHGLNEKTWRNIVLNQKLLEKADAAIRDGRIRHLGFSFHDRSEVFPEILNAYEWTFCQIQYNYMDTENQAGTKGLKLAAEKGIAAVIMEPLLGGRLANPPEKIRQTLEQSGLGMSPAELAFQWIWDQPEVTTVLSGMSSMEQVKANIEAANRAKVGAFPSSAHEVIEKIRAQYRERTTIPCTKCNYCMPCPNGVNIPNNFEMFNNAHAHEDFPEARFVYKTFVPEHERASACIDCDVCEDLCPQHIPISDWMPKVAAALSEQ